MPQDINETLQDILDEYDAFVKTVKRLQNNLKQEQDALNEGW
jgi:DNA anti-recombination protein RmuC